MAGIIGSTWIEKTTGVRYEVFTTQFFPKLVKEGCPLNIFLIKFSQTRQLGGGLGQVRLANTFLGKY